MHTFYKDILERIDAPPSWFDDAGVPRYCGFTPKHLNNIHAREAVLADIACQQCGRLFRVGMAGRSADQGRGLCDEFRLGDLSYGDPPNVACCSGGPSMTSDMLRVVEYWSRENGVDWFRDPAFEGPLPLRCAAVDVVAEVMAAAGRGVASIRVDCTSPSHRYHVAGRTVAAMVARGRVLFVHPDRAGGHLLRGYVGQEEVGYAGQPRAATIVGFSQLPEISVDGVASVIILSGAPPGMAMRADVKKAHEEVWERARVWLAAAAPGRVVVELALAGRRRAIEAPGVIIDGWQTQPLPA